MTRTLTIGEFRGGRRGDAELGEVGEVGDVGDVDGGPGRWGSGDSAILDGLDDLDDLDGASVGSRLGIAATRSAVEAAGMPSGQFTFPTEERGGSGMLGCV